MPPKPYHKKWFSISETLASLTGNSNAKAAICNAIADARLHLSFLVPQLDACHYCRPASGSSLQTRTRIRREIACGHPRANSRTPSGRAICRPDAADRVVVAMVFRCGVAARRLGGILWALAELELLAADVKKVLGGAPPVLISEWQQQERAAIEWLASEFRKRGNPSNSLTHKTPAVGSLT